jgi:dTDP-4-dehydrorhamnose 3,5-epimerase
MEFVETELKGCFVVRPKRIEDARGHFARAWCRDEFAQHGLNPDMLQLNTGFSHKAGTVRGLHYQQAPHAEAKFARCTRGAIFDVVVDLRAESPTRGRWFGIELSADDGAMVYVPEGCAHGYQALVDGAEMYYLTSARYAPAAASGVRFDDPAFGIAWPAPVSIVSDQDRNWPAFS